MLYVDVRFRQCTICLSHEAPGPFDGFSAPPRGVLRLRIEKTQRSRTFGAGLMRNRNKKTRPFGLAGSSQRLTTAGVEARSRVGDWGTCKYRCSVTARA